MQRWLPLLFITLMGLALPSQGFGTEPASQPWVRQVSVLAINDVYRIDGVDEGASGGIARVRSLRRELEREDPNLLLLQPMICCFRRC